MDQIGRRQGQCRKVVKTVALCALLIVFVLGLFIAYMTRTTVPTPDKLESRGLIVLPTARDLEIPPLIDQSGGRFDQEALKNRWSFVFFGYTSCPDICPVTMSILRQAEQTISDYRFQGVLVSVDPARDDVETMRLYVDAFSSRFLGITGERRNLFMWARQLSAGFGNAVTRDGGHPASHGYLIDHSGHVAILNPEGQFVAILKRPFETQDVVDVFRSIERHL
jgi:protein SCO1/2